MKHRYKPRSGCRFKPLNQGSKSLFAALDTVVAGHDLNLGVGRGLSRDSDRWVIKAIVNFRLDGRP